MERANPIFLLLLAVAGGIVAGAASSLFLYGLTFVTTLRDSNPWLVVFLPVAGFLIALIYKAFGPSLNLRIVMEESSTGKRPIPLRLAPMILITTWATHLFGGSAGREGTAVQMAAALSDRVGRLFRLDPLSRRKLLISGLGAGFASAIGAPLAGGFFALEVLRRRGIRWFAYREAFVASFAAFYTSKLLHAPHTEFPFLQRPAFSLPHAGAAICLGISFGLIARLFVFSTHYTEKLFARTLHPLWRPVVGGIFLLGFFAALGNLRYAGLGLPVIQETLRGDGHFKDLGGKFLATVITLGSGYKGGEFIPLVFLGTTAGAALAPLFFFPASSGALLGFGAVFGAAAQTPIACAIMSAELFGWNHLPFTLVASLTAYFVSGPSGIYPAQRKGSWPWQTRIL
jgi:H+/Cl- antiporter ClcA